MSNRFVAATIVVALFLTAGIWVYGQYVADDSAIQRFSAIATAIAAAAGFFAFVALVVYTRETFKLRKVAEQQVAIAQQQVAVAEQQVAVAQQQVKQAQIQNETAIRPILSFDVAERRMVEWVNVETSEETAPTVNDAFVMRNLGLGPALNIRTECDSDDIELDVGPSTILGQGQTVPVGILVFSETPEQRTFAAVQQNSAIFSERQAAKAH